MGEQGSPPLCPPWMLALIGGPAPLFNRPAPAGGGTSLSRRGHPFSEAISKKEKKGHLSAKIPFSQKIWRDHHNFYRDCRVGPACGGRWGLQGGPLKNLKWQGPCTAPSSYEEGGQRGGLAGKRSNFGLGGGPPPCPLYWKP